MSIGLSFYIPLIFYFLCFLVVILTILYRIEWGLLYLVFILPLQNILEKIQTFPLGKDFVDILVISLLFAWIIRRKNKDGIVFEKTPLNIPIFLYIVVTYISLWWGSFNFEIDLPISINDIRFQNWKNLVLLPILYLITVKNVRDPKWVKAILLVGLVSIFLTDFFFYREFSWYKHSHYSHDMRVSGPFTYLGPNEIGAFFAQYGVLIFGLLLFANKRSEKILLGLLFLFNLYCLMYSFSRAAYLAFPIGLAFQLFFKSKKLLLVFIILLILLPAFLPVSVIERIQMTTLSEEQKDKVRMSNSEVGPYSNAEPMFDPSAQGRFDIWKNALEVYKSNLIFGIGFDTYINLHLGGRRLDTHNNYVKILTELGIIGLILYLYLYYLAFKSGWYLYRRSRGGLLSGLGLGFAACVIANMVCNITHDNWSYLNLMGLYWIYWGLIVISKTIVERELSKDLGIDVIDQK